MSPRSEETENERLLRGAGPLEYQQQPTPEPAPFDPLVGTYAMQPLGHREGRSLWGVAARRIDVRRLPQLKGDTADAVVRNGQPDFFGLDPDGDTPSTRNGSTATSGRSRSACCKSVP